MYSAITINTNVRTQTFLDLLKKYAVNVCSAATIFKQIIFTHRRFYMTSIPNTTSRKDTVMYIQYLGSDTLFIFNKSNIIDSKLIRDITSFE